jgi:hypothetical protein
LPHRSAWTEPVGAEVDEAAHRALGSDRIRDRQLVEAVLRRQYIAVGSEVRQQLTYRRAGRLRLHRQDNAPVLTSQRLGSCRWHDRHEFLDRAGDAQPFGAARRDMIGHDVDEQDRHAGARPVGRDRAADRAAAPNDHRLSGHPILPSLCSRWWVATVRAPSGAPSRDMPSVITAHRCCLALAHTKKASIWEART